MPHDLERPDALILAGKNRLRPSAMSSLAARLALLPLALGQGAAMQQPLALAIISGLALQLPLVLIVLPVLLATLIGIAPKSNITYQPRNLSPVQQKLKL